MNKDTLAILAIIVPAIATVLGATIAALVTGNASAAVAAGTGCGVTCYSLMSA